ncbi:MAG: hypothetical protein HFF52_02925 [Lawsonibacter sp.]|nr:hypothetical protein [Lawsonibacter sp.]
MSKKFSVFLTALFCAFIGGVTVISLLLPDKSFSSLENRYLQKPPKLSVESLSDGTFMKDAEDYVSDHIVGRDFWVAAKAWSERLSGKKENNGVYFGSQDTLINRVETPDPAELDKKVGYVDTLASNVSVPVYFGLIPSAADIWKDRLPKGAPTADERSIIEQLYFFTGANTIDLYGALAPHSGEDIYYRTDHHWTSLGAYYGANAILEAMGLEPLDLNSYQKTTVTDQFYGTSFSTSGVRWLPPDQIDTYVPDEGVKVTAYPNGAPEEGSLYVDSKLEVKDKYAYFLGGNQPLCVIETAHTDAPKVLVIRDSYADSLAPFLTERFSEVHLFDLRYNMISIKSYVEEHNIDTVVVLYSFSNFASDDNLALLTR